MQERLLRVIERLTRGTGTAKDPPLCELFDRPDLTRGASDRDRERPCRGRRRHDDLDALATWERGGEERGFFIDPLMRGVRHEFRKSPAPVEVREREPLALPPAAGFQERLARGVDADFRDVRTAQERSKRAKREGER